MNIQKIIFLIVSLAFVYLNSCTEDDVDAPAASTVADFSYTVSNNAIAPATVTFTNKSVNTSYFEWDFGNGETSNAQNPTVTYNQPGTYNVTLTVEPEENLYYNRVTKEASIKIKAQPLKSLYYLDKFDNKVKYVVLDTADPVVQEYPGLETISANFMTIDTANAFMYISDRGSSKITKAALDGSSIEQILDITATPEGGAPWGITVVEDKLYFALVSSNDEGKIMRCNLDGTNLEVAVEITDYLPLDLTYNPTDQKLYFSNDGYYDDGGIWSVNTDGSQLEVVVQNHNSSPVDAAGIDIDHENGRIFYSHYADQVIVMNTMDGNNPQVVGTYTNSKLLYGLSVDVDNGYIYWADRPGSDGDGDGNIIRASYTVNGDQITVGTQETWIDGTQVDIAPYGLALDTYR